MPRKLTLKARAERQRQTRRRITEAAVALHESVGPAGTSISAIARRAGVQRVTFYRHFPDQAALLEACSAHYMVSHPPPDPQEWLQAPDPLSRVERALTGLYAYYRTTEAMNSRLMRDAAVMPLVADMMQGYRGFMAMLSGLLADGFGPGATGRLLPPALGHALDFQTWSALTSHGGLSDQDAAALMMEMVRSAAGASTPRDLHEGEVV